MLVLTAPLFLSGRDYHSMHHENMAFRFDAERRGAVIAPDRQKTIVLPRPR
jgi:hypothetical protein